MSEKILITGNEAIGEAAVRAGCQFYAGYPITPQNELTAYMSWRMPEAGRIFIQAESELAAINMVHGAAAAGARAMTSSSSPGISLKQEGLSYLAGSQLPAVIVNIMRGGPGLGNIAPAQSDYFQAVKGGGHGDYRTIVLAPATVQEMMELTHLAFELTDIYRNPVVILGDGMLGQMMEPVVANGKWQIANSNYKPPAISHKPKSWALNGCRGREPNVIKSLFLKEGELEQWNRELQEKYDEIDKKEVRAEAPYIEDSQLILIAYGSVARICASVMARMRQEGLKVGLIRPITLWPFPSKLIEEVARQAKGLLVVEMSAGQMLEDVKLACGNLCPVYFYGRTGGGIPTEEKIEQTLRELIT